MRTAILLLALGLLAPVVAAQESNKKDQEKQEQEKEEARLLKKARRLAEDDDKAGAFAAFVEVARLARAHEHVATAVAALEEARAVAPDEASEAQVLRDLGHLYMTQDEPSKSVKAYRRAAKLAPEDAAIQNSLGYSLHLAGDEDESIAAFEKCIELDPSNKEARYSLGLAARLAGKPAKALRAHERLVEAGKRDELGVAWYFAFESAKAKVTGKGIELGAPAQRLAVCELEVAIDRAFLDELDKAEEAIDSLKEKTDKDDLAPALAVALDETERALELRPQHLQLHYLLALLHEARGDKADAKAELEKFVAAEKALRPLAKKAKEKLEASRD